MDGLMLGGVPIHHGGDCVPSVYRVGIEGLCPVELLSSIVCTVQKRAHRSSFFVFVWDIFYGFYSHLAEQNPHALDVRPI
jgi:hypothetical protein